MKWLNNRFLPLIYVGLLASFVVIGCTGKQDPFETLVVCGNHTCGELAMVTTDTSSKGFHYLNPSLSPDGSEVLFSADWNAMPADEREPEDQYYVNYRQMVTIPYIEGGNDRPALDLADQGAELIRLVETSIRIQGGVVSLVGVVNYDKGDPIWQDDLHVIFAMRVNAIGMRIFRADITDKDRATLEPLFLEPTDNDEQPRQWNHVNPQISPDGRWLVFVRSGCIDPQDLGTCEDTAIWAMDMSTAGDGDGYDTKVFPLTDDYKRLERPSFSPDSRRLAFSSYLDVVGYSGSDESATEIFAMDFDTTGLDVNDTNRMVLDRNLERITFTDMAEGDPLNGVLNYYPSYSLDGNEIYFVSTRRAPATTVHARAVWKVPANGGFDPEIHFFSRFDDSDPYIMWDGTIMLSSTFGFPTEMLDVLEEEAYNRIKQENEEAHEEDPANNPLLSEVELRQQAADERRQLENFEGVMSHIYVFGGP